MIFGLGRSLRAVHERARVPPPDILAAVRLAGRLFGWLIGWAVGCLVGCWLFRRSVLEDTVDIGWRLLMVHNE